MFVVIFERFSEPRPLPLRALFAMALLCIVFPARPAGAFHNPCSSTVPLACGATLSGTISTQGETDCFSFSAVADDAVSITTTETSSGINACWEVLDNVGALLTRTCGQGIVRVPSSGSYVVRVVDNGDNGTGTYAVNLAVLSASASSCADALPCGTSISKTIAVAENHTYQFTAASSQQVQITTTGTGNFINVCWELYDPTGHSIVHNCGAGLAGVVGGLAYTVRVYENGNDENGSYEVALACTGSGGPTPSTPGNTATPTPKPTPTSRGHLDDPLAVKASKGCANAIARAGVKLVQTKLKLLGDCTGALVKCVQVSGSDPACLQKAAERCSSGIDRIATIRQALIDAVNAACGKLTGDELLDGGGFAFDDVAERCGTEFQTSVVDGGSAMACVARQHDCRSNTLFELQEPRAKELMRVAGVDGARIDALSCLEDFGGSGTSLDNATLGGLLQKCDKSLRTAASAFAVKILGNLTKCVAAAFRCAQNPLDARCAGQASASCQRALGKNARAGDALVAAIAKRCPPAVYGAMVAPSGLQLAALAGECAGYGVPALAEPADYASCLLRQHRCRAVELLRFEFPRSDELLASLVPSITLGACADIGVGVPTPHPTVTPSLCGNGTLDPGEECDTGLANSNTLPDACRKSCKLPFCGDAVIDSFEDCEGKNLDGENCQSIGFDGGSLRCDAECFFDDTRCTDAP